MTEPRVAPHDSQAEAAVLSAVLLVPGTLAAIADRVRPASFYAGAHGRIFEAAEALAAEGRPVDVVTVGTWLRDHGRLAEVGGLPYLTELLGAAPAVGNVGAYAETVARKYRVRRMLEAAARIVAEGYGPLEDEDEFLDRAEAAVHEVALTRTATAAAETMRAVLGRVFTKLQEANDRAPDGRARYTGTPTGFGVFDDATGGMHDGELGVFAARPAMGKTAIAMNMAANVAAQGKGVIVFSLEMPNEQLATRALCSAAGVSVLKARTSTFDRSDWAKLTGTVDRISKPPHFYLVDKPCALLDIRSIARGKQSDMARAQVPLKLIVVDYIQLMQAREGIRQREEAVSDNARGLKLLAKELGCHILVLSQLNRGVESRADRRPMLGDMKESGAIEESADYVAGMYRDDYYHKESRTPGIVELILLKQKHGPAGMVSVGFDAQSVTFYNLADTDARVA